MRATKATKEQRDAIARLVDITMVEGGNRYIVGPGDKREGMRGRQIAVIGLRHHPGYEIVLQLDNGKTDSFTAACLHRE